MKPQELRKEKTLTVPVSICRVCDEGRDPLDVPDEPCGHDAETHRSTVTAEYVALAEVLGYLRGSDSDDHEYEQWRRTIADDIEREFSGA